MVRWLFAFLLLPFAAGAASPGELARLHAALETGELMAILSEEGRAQSEELREEMFPGRGGAGWRAVVARIYAPERLEATFRAAFDAALADVEIGGILDFYDSETGARVSALEVEARRAIMSEDVEDAARASYAALLDDDAPRAGLLQDFAELNDLIERNVAGALNANLAFYDGLRTGDAFTMTEEQMLDEVRASEAEIRADTEGWLFGYMALAYDPLSDAELRAYIDMTATDAGQDVNRALFAGFDAVFVEVSHALGEATARFSVGEEL